MARYARELDADVIALQEVDGVRAARQLFPRHSFCFSKRSAVQNLGFAVRSGIPHACGADLTSLSLGDTVRRGVELRLFPGSAREMRLLSVHLKSGCSRDPLDSSRESCGQLARQVPELKRWMDMQSAAGLPFAVLGDFNRDLLRSGGGLWPEAGLVNTAEGQSFQNCMPSQTFSGYIDYILLSRDAARGLVAHSFGRNLYRPADAARRKLSDHCPLFIRLRLLDSRPSPT